MQSEEVLKFFAKYIEEELGIVYADHNYFQLQNRLEEIAKQVGATDINALVDQAKSGIFGPFRQLLLDQATNNETSFFRDPKIFSAVEKVALKAASTLVASGEPLRIWSAASSTGQEALSIAMLVNEFNSREHTHIQVSILGTDISERVLAKAKSASYSELEVQRGLSPAFLSKYFNKGEADRYLVTSEISRLIEYKSLNLKSAFTFAANFHVVFLRNVLIYQNVEGKAKILSRVTSALVPGGYLILGAGESLMGISDEYDQENCEGAILYKKKGVLAKVA